MRTVYLLSAAAPKVPYQYKDAIKSADRGKWEQAMKKEYDSLIKMGTWIPTPTDLPKGRKAIKCRWVYAIKADGRYKARLVAKGYTQQFGIDYEQTFSPVARFESIRYILAHAALMRWHIHSMDVETAFLNGDLKELHEEERELYITQPEGFEERRTADRHKVYRLKKAIYGLKQASRQWYLKFNQTLKTRGFKRTHSDAGVYVRITNNPQDYIAIILYVDDLLIFGPNLLIILELKKLLQQDFLMKDLGQATSYLGLRINQDHANQIITIDQESYIHDAVKKFQLENAKTARTPLPSSATYVKNPNEATPELRTKYQSLIGTLLYIMLGSRPDIAYHVTRLSRYNSNPSEHHYNAAIYILKYLKGTAHYKLKYDGKSNSGLIGYSDSTWADNVDNRHSTSGCVFFLANGPISWQSRCQDTVALSSTEAEYMEITEAARQCAWLRTFEQEIGFTIDDPTPICSDNQGAIFITHEPVVQRRSKHIDIRFHYIREFVEEAQAKILYVPTEEMVADTLTKALPYESFNRHRIKLGLIGN